jgi:uncharacterized protein (DUF2267 family)
MTIPMEYQHASRDFERFLADIQDRLGFATRNPAYTTVEGVLLTFRRRLNVAQALAFANLLPPVLRALFVADFDSRQRPVPFASRDELTREVQSLRRDHNFAPPTAIAEVAAALRKIVDVERLDDLLHLMPEGAAAYWSGEASTG